LVHLQRGVSVGSAVAASRNVATTSERIWHRDRAVRESHERARHRRLRAGEVAHPASKQVSGEIPLLPCHPQQSVGVGDELGYVVGVADQADTGAVIAEHHRDRVVAEIVDLDSGCVLAVELSSWRR
jgi:hypothetical protein